MILAHDLGTTGNKATLFSDNGTLLGSAFAGYDTQYPRANWAEQDANDWWHAVCKSTHQVILESDVTPSQIAAVGFSGHMMGCLPVDANGRPLRSCIIWADQRAQVQADQLAASVGADALYRMSGHRVSASYTIPKIMWIREVQADIFAKTFCFLQPKDFVIYHLTGEMVTDYSDASGTLSFDLQTRAWDQNLFDAIALRASLMPRLHSSTAIVGEVSKRAAVETGLAPGTPVVVGGGDGACAGVGAGVVVPGAAYCNWGSSAWISVSSEEPVLDSAQRTITFHHVHPEYYCPMGVMQAAGGARDWAWQTLAGTTVELDEAVETVAPGANGLLFLPHLLGERSPFWNSAARGAFIGLAMTHGPAEMARATMEGVVLNLSLILDTLRQQVKGISAIRFVGGGSRSRALRQILADAFQLPVDVLDLTADVTSWGAAVTAGVGVGLYDWSIAGERAQVVTTVTPIADNVSLYAELSHQFVEAYHRLKEVSAVLAAVENRSNVRSRYETI